MVEQNPNFDDMGSSHVGSSKSMSVARLDLRKDRDQGSKLGRPDKYYRRP